MCILVKLFNIINIYLVNICLRIFRNKGLDELLVSTPSPLFDIISFSPREVS